MAIEHKLPTGLSYHCLQCRVVVPSDAPKSGQADCETVAKCKLAWFDPKTTIAAQFVMAVAAWQLIYHQALKDGDVEVAEYKAKFQADRKSHYEDSATRKALTPEQIEAEIAHSVHGRRDAWIYKQEVKEIDGN